LSSFRDRIVSFWMGVDLLPLSKEERIRLKHYYMFILLGIPIMSGYGLYNVFFGSLVISLLCIVVASVLVIGAVRLYQLKNGNLMYRCNAFACIFLILYCFVNGGDDGSKALWAYTMPLIVFFLLGKKEGLFWTAVVSGGIIVLLAMPFTYPYSGEFIARFFTSFTMISIIAYWFEYFRFTYFRQLLVENERFQDILDQSRDIIYRRDIQTGCYNYISKAFYDLLGYPAVQVASMSYEDMQNLVHPEDLAIHNNFFEHLVSCRSMAGRPETIEYRLRHKDGSYRWVSDQMTVIRDDKGEPAFVVGINREITREKEIREELEQSRDQLVALLNSIDAHIYVVDINTYEVLFMNDKMSRDFGKDGTGLKCWQVFERGDGPCKHCTNRILLDEHNQPTGVQEWERYNEVTGRWYNNYDRAIRWHDGRWVKLQVAMDINRLKNLEAERMRNDEIIHRARQMEIIGTLAGGIAHDFNNLLQGISGYLSILENTVEPGSDIARYCANMSGAADRAMELSSYLLTFSTGGAPALSIMDIEPIIQKAIDKSRGEYKAECELSVVPELAQVKVDERQLFIALRNIIQNGLESMPEGGTVRIQAETCILDERGESTLPAGRYIRITVTDEGPGIAAQELKRIFDPYYSTKEKKTRQGLGLGLSVSFSIMKKHDGDIRIQSEPGVGTTLEVLLPAVEEDVQDSSEKMTFSNCRG